MKTHLVTFATNCFRPRQILLGWSALANNIVDTVTHWTPMALLSSGFDRKCPRIHLSERGSGFYSWKPFIIQHKLLSLPDGDIVFYCDVGRTFPYKLLSCSLQFFSDWINHHHQSVMPGVRIPWNGSMSKWTKRDAFIELDMDSSLIHAESPIQASFSLWINNTDSRRTVEEWMNLSSNRQLISDDPSMMGRPELPDFTEHRHDQALLSLVCLKHGIKGLDIGNKKPALDTKHPSEVTRFIERTPVQLTNKGRFVAQMSIVMESVEWIARRGVKLRYANYNHLMQNA